MADLKLRLLDKIVQSRYSQASSNLSSETTELDKTVIYQAVEDRICKRTDLATRTDLTYRETIGALRLLIGIVRRSGLPIEFSPREIEFLTRGISYGTHNEPMLTESVRKSTF